MTIFFFFFFNLTNTNLFISVPSWTIKERDEQNSINLDEEKNSVLGPYWEVSGCSILYVLCTLLLGTLSLKYICPVFLKINSEPRLAAVLRKPKQNHLILNTAMYWNPNYSCKYITQLFQTSAKANTLTVTTDYPICLQTVPIFVNTTIYVKKYDQIILWTNVAVHKNPIT